MTVLLECLDVLPLYILLLPLKVQWSITRTHIISAKLTIFPQLISPVIPGYNLILSFSTQQDAEILSRLGSSHATFQSKDR